MMDEKEFQKVFTSLPWFKEFVQQSGEEPNANDPYYDYRAALAAGALPQRYEPDNNRYHWDSRFKKEGHPNEVVGGANTRTGKMVDLADMLTYDILPNFMKPK